MAPHEKKAPKNEPKPQEDRRQKITFSRYFTSIKGNVFDARDYGHEYWPIGKRS